MYVSKNTQTQINLMQTLNISYKSKHKHHGISGLPPSQGATVNDDDDERFLKTSRNAASGDVEGFTALTKTASGNDEVSQFRRR